MSQQYPDQPYAQQPDPQPPMLPAQQPPGGPQYGNYPVPQQAGYPQSYGIGYPQQQVAAKSPGLALVASFFIPGLGSLINGSVGIGIAIFVSYCVAWALTLVLIGFILVPAVWVWGMIDAYQGARNWNARHGIIS
jgi:TM2 domain-containing membrane protein YozV